MNYWIITIIGRIVLVQAVEPSTAMSRAIRSLPRLYPEVNWRKAMKNPNGQRMHIRCIPKETYDRLVESGFEGDD